MPDIKVAEITAKTTAKGKAYWLVKDGNGQSHGVWESSIHALLEQHLGQPISVVIRQDGKYTTIEKAELPPPPVEKTGGWKRDPAESSLIVRQSCLKAAVEYFAVAKGDRQIGMHDVLNVAEGFVDWVYGSVAPAAEPVRTGATPSPTTEQRAAREHLTTGKPYSAALKDGESLADAARRAVAEAEAVDLTHIPPADAQEYGPSSRTPGRERLTPSGPARR